VSAWDKGVIVIVVMLINGENLMDWIYCIERFKYFFLSFYYLRKFIYEQPSFVCVGQNHLKSGKHTYRSPGSGLTANALTDT